ncbi:hypothetical protein [Mesorhizobium delmotii]|uniref:hypothetical protein n=1 Tax=Mesorhizobium delmotii TaxID=1631247 RepID=UPI003CC7ED76
MKADPDNRLVADTLETEWNEKLRLHTDVVEDYERRAPEEAAALDAETQQRVRDLAEQFPRIWSDARIDVRERKRILRLLVADVTLVKAETTTANVRLSGGATRTLTLERPLPIAEIRKFKPELVAEVDRLLDRHCDREIADILNEGGQRPGKASGSIPRRSPSSGQPTTCPAVASACGIVVCSRPGSGRTLRYRRDHGASLGAPGAHHQSLQRQSQPWSVGHSSQPRYHQRPPGPKRRCRPPCLNYRAINRTGLTMKQLPCRVACGFGRQDGGVVMLGHGGKGRVQRRLEPQRLGNPGLQIVADDRLGDPAEEAESPHLAVDPVLWLKLAKGEGQVGGAQHRDEDLGGVNDPVAGSITGTVCPA